MFSGVGARAPSHSVVGPSVGGGGGSQGKGTVLVMQPGWFVTLPRLFPGDMETKRHRLPIKMLWELEAKSIPDSPQMVSVEMRPAPGYIDFFAKLIPPEMLHFQWPLRRWETLRSAGDSRCALEEAAAAADSVGLVPVPPNSALWQVYNNLQERTMEGLINPNTLHVSGPKESHSVPSVAAAVLRDGGYLGVVG
ncbi:unnamed protein product, partial [Discosporangium mesarthrocarpum]